ncbi:MAG: polymerase alpha subunit [Ferruginibacter sp.]|nr:polymerase alpha subunit [Ferruginibacter sp.]
MPYGTPGNWPHAVQVSWLIYTKEGEKVLEQNYYVGDNDFEISATALRIHGLAKDFLQKNGIPRRQLLELLSKDLQQYQPMIVGHFAELDYRILGADYHREALDNPMEHLPTFCIMLASKHLQQNPHQKFLRLGDLYELLFKKPLLHQHNAIVDATATAECFFELVKRNEIKSFIQPPIVFQQEEKMTWLPGWIIALLLVLLIAFIITRYYG